MADGIVTQPGHHDDSQEPDGGGESALLSSLFDCWQNANETGAHAGNSLGGTILTSTLEFPAPGGRSGFAFNGNSIPYSFGKSSAWALAGKVRFASDFVDIIMPSGSGSHFLQNRNSNRIRMNAFLGASGSRNLSSVTDGVTFVMTADGTGTGDFYLFTEGGGLEVMETGQSFTSTLDDPFSANLGVAAAGAGVLADLWIAGRHWTLDDATELHGAGLYTDL